MKFHIDDKGNINKCSATSKKCPYGGIDGKKNHFNSVIEAAQAYEKIMEDEAAAVPVINETRGLFHWSDNQKRPVQCVTPACPYGDVPHFKEYKDMSKYMLDSILSENQIALKGKNLTLAIDLVDMDSNERRFIFDNAIKFGVPDQLHNASYKFRAFYIMPKELGWGNDSFNWDNPDPQHIELLKKIKEKNLLNNDRFQLWNIIPQWKESLEFLPNNNILSKEETERLLTLDPNFCLSSANREPNNLVEDDREYLNLANNVISTQSFSTEELKKVFKGLNRSRNANLYYYYEPKSHKQIKGPLFEEYTTFILKVWNMIPEQERKGLDR